MEIPLRTSAKKQRKFLPGRLLYLGEGAAWKDILVEIHDRNLDERPTLIPAVAEPQLIWQMSGHVLCSDRDLDGNWNTHESEPGVLFLSTSPEPYELKWKALGKDPLVVMHVTLGLPFFARAAQELDGPSAKIPRLKEINAFRDPTIISFLEMLRREVSEQKTASISFVQGIAQSLATYLVRTYRDDETRTPHRSPALPAFHLLRVLKLMDASIEEGIHVGKLAEAVQMSEAHFSRLFKRNTGFSPSHYFIRQRVAKAQELLRETHKPIIEIGSDVGYGNPSHFAHVFRKETGITPSEYRERTIEDLPTEDFSRISIA